MPAEDQNIQPRLTSTPFLVDPDELDFTFARPTTPPHHSANQTTATGKSQFLRSFNMTDLRRLTRELCKMTHFGG